jgi:hypothetical protein
MHDGIELTCKVRPGGALRKYDSEILRGALARAAESNQPWVLIKIESYEDTRSNRQNAYYWGVVNKAWMRILNKHGNNLGPLQVHDHLKQNVAPSLFVERFMFKGKWQTIVKSSARMTKSQWEEWMELLRAEAKAEGVTIGLPNEELPEDEAETDNYGVEE